MVSRFYRALRAMELEEQILHAGLVLSVIGVFLPWISGDWFGDDKVLFIGLGFYTAYLGWIILFLSVFQILMTVVPLAGGPNWIPKQHRDILRLVLSGQSFILTTAALSVLFRVSFEFTRMDVRLGIYLTLVGTGVALLESAIRFSAQRKHQSQEVFRHPEDTPPSTAKEPATPPMATPPPPPPPAPPPIEEHPHHP